MRRDLLHAAEKEFLSVYPGGFENPTMEEIMKKHKPKKMHELTVSLFGEDKFDDIDMIIDGIGKIVSRSSLVSVFEKTKFRDYIKNLSDEMKGDLADGLKDLLHGDRKKGFEKMVALLSREKLAKWTIITVIPYYYRPNTEVFIKPTTTKNIIAVFELENLVYHPRPAFLFYEDYKRALLKMKQTVDKSLAPTNAAFTGFLMMMMERRDSKRSI